MDQEQGGWIGTMERRGHIPQPFSRKKKKSIRERKKEDGGSGEVGNRLGV